MVTSFKAPILLWFAFAESGMMLASSITFDRLIASVMEDHLPDLIADLLPVVNEVTGLFSAHNFNALVFEDGDNRFGIATPGSPSV
jgi:hypothetical protein